MKKYGFRVVVAILFFIIGWATNILYDMKYGTKESPKVVEKKVLVLEEVPIAVNKLPMLLEKLQKLLDKPQTLLQKIQAKKHLDVIILNAPTVYYLGPTGPTGFEYELISDYAKSIGVDLNLTVVHTVQEAIEKTKEGVGDITEASLSVTKEREEKIKFGPQYYGMYEQLICHNSLYKEGTMPRDIKGLINLNIVVGKNTSYETTLLKIKEKLDGFDFNTTENLSTEQLLEQVWKKEIDCTVTDSNIFMLNQRYYPELARVMILGEQSNLAWAIREGDQTVNESLYKWLNKYDRSGKMADLTGLYYGFLNIFDYYDTKVFYKRIKDVLPRYENYFRNAGEKYDVSWMILAAQSYQESHWKPDAQSYTGVRGMMMLTKATAELLKVKNRLSPKQSIYGGAKYFDMMRNKFSEKTTGKNLWAFTLAAYNIGLGHIYDAQKLAKKLNKNPYSWSDLKTVLPLLSQRKHYKNLKHGYARGNEPVRYVNAIQHYYDILEKTRISNINTAK